MKIPVQNLYYLLSYAWNRLDESRRVPVAKDDYHQLQALLAKVLINACVHLIKRGLDRDYLELEETYPGIKGKIQFSESLRRNTFPYGRAICRFDDFSANILQNQLIRSTLSLLLRLDGLESDLLAQVKSVRNHFWHVDEIPLTLPAIKQVRIHRNNQYYSFVLQICQFLVENTVLNEEDGTYLFKDFLREGRQMAYLFEDFVRNFYRQETPEYRVGRENINWAVEPIGESDMTLLPIMQTDISLTSADRKIIVETKYYSQTLTGQWDGDRKFHSSNLYQLFAYLKNAAAQSPDNELLQQSTGILLYPTVQQEIDQHYQMGNHELRIATVNLSSDWRAIENRLLELVRV